MVGVSLAFTGTVAPTSGPDCGDVEYHGDGTTQQPFEVDGVKRLQCVGGDHADVDGELEALSSDYVMVDDVDAGVTEQWVGGFEPIGRYSLRFQGSFDGDGYVVEDVYLDRGDDSHVGLFGYNEGTVERLGVENGRVEGDFNVGGVVGTNAGTVEEVYSDVDVEGGLRVGGVAGANDGAVARSYSLSEVVADETAGGVVGRNTGDVEEVYAAGTVFAGVFEGGAVAVDEGSVSTAYWDRDATGQRLSEGSPEAHGLSTEDLTGDGAVDHLAGFDFTDTWVATDSYPVLLWRGGLFHVEVAGYTESVEEGETVEVEANLSNSGASDGVRGVSLSVEGETVDSVSGVGVESSGSRSFELEWMTSEGDVGSYTMEVATARDTEVVDVAVEPRDTGEDEPDVDDGGDEGLPGFGFLAAAAAVSTLLAGRLRRRR